MWRWRRGQPAGFRDQHKLVVNFDPGQERVKCTVYSVHFTLQVAQPGADLLGYLEALVQVGNLGLQTSKAVVHLRVLIQVNKQQ